VTFLEIATPLIARGIPVTPLLPRTKIAFMTGWETSATADLAQIQSWNVDPACNCGSVAKAEAGNIWLFEFDNKGVLDRIKADTGRELLMNTFITRSSPGKGHFYWKQNAASIAMGNISQGFVKGGDWSARVNNAYCVAPGSTHPITGLPYEVLCADSIIEAPQFLIDWCVSQKIEKKVSTTLDPDGPEVPRGQHDDTLHSMAGKLRYAGLGEESIYRDLVDTCEARFLDLGDDWEEMCRKHAHNICKHPVGKDERVFVGDHVAGEPSRSAPATAPAVNYNDLLKGDMKDGTRPWILDHVQKPSDVPSKKVEWIIDRMIIVGGLHVFSSLPGGQKSVFSLLLTKVISESTDLLGRKSGGLPITVIVLDKENPPSVVYERLVGLGLLDFNNVRVWGEWNFDGAGPVPEKFDDPRLTECALRMGTDVVFVTDSLSAFTEGKDENSVSEMNPILRKALRLARLCGGVIILHHTDKQGISGRGTVAIRANSDMAFLMSKDKKEVITISPERFRPCPEWTLKYQMDWSKGAFTPSLISDSLVGLHPPVEVDADPTRLVKAAAEQASRDHYIRRAQEEIEKAYDSALDGKDDPIENRTQLATLIGLNPEGKMARAILNGNESNPWECVKGERNSIVYLPKGVTTIPPKAEVTQRAKADGMFGEGKTVAEVTEALGQPSGTVRSWRTKWGKKHENE
jgi:hypothetical protein